MPIGEDPNAREIPPLDWHRVLCAAGGEFTP